MLQTPTPTPDGIKAGHVRLREQLERLRAENAALGGEQSSAAQAAATEPLTVPADERLDRAAQLMVQHGASHLVVLDAAHGHPIAVLSTLDIASVYATESKR